MTENNTKNFYTSPQMKVVEIKARHVLCQTSQLEQITRETGEYE